MPQTPMPSPLGTNYERLFLQSDFCLRSVGALDQAPRDKGELNDAISALQGFLRDSLTNPNDVARGDSLLAAVLECLGVAGDQLSEPATSGGYGGTFAGRTAMDARSVADFDRRFPDARRIRTGVF